MKMSLVVEGFRSDVAAVGDLGDDATADIADRIATMLSRSASSRILDLLSDVAAELSAELPEGRVEIRLVGDDVQLTYIDDAPSPVEGDSELSARITLRLSEQLKGRVEAGASHDGISVNTFVLRALERGTSIANVRRSHGGSRLHGYGTS